MCQDALLLLPRCMTHASIERTVVIKSKVQKHITLPFTLALRLHTDP